VELDRLGPVVELDVFVVDTGPQVGPLRYRERPGSARHGFDPVGPARQQLEIGCFHHPPQGEQGVSDGRSGTPGHLARTCSR
jgi:hypothetical protein